MIIQSRHRNFNIAYDEDTKKYFIVEKCEVEIKPIVGGFNFAAEAIEFGLTKVI